MSQRETPAWARPARPFQRPRLSLRVTLLTLVLGLLLATVLPIALLSYFSTRETITDLERRYFRAVSDLVAERLRAVVAPAGPMLEQARFDAASGLLDVDDPDAVAAYLLSRLRVEPRAAGFYYGDQATGRFTEARHGAEGKLQLDVVVPTASGRERTETILDAAGNVLQRTAPTADTYDPRERPWYAPAAASDAIVWTEPYLFFRPERLGITAALAVREPGASTPRGVFGVDFYFRELADLLSEFVRNPHGRAYLLDREGHIIALSHPDEAEQAAALLATALGALPAPLATLPVETPRPFSMNTPAGRYVGAVEAFALTPNVDWVMLYVVPEAEYLRTVYGNLRIAVAVGVAVLLLALALAVRLSLGVSRPVRFLADDLARVGQFELAATPMPRSSIDEVMTLGDAVARMKASLRSFERYVPSDLVRGLLARGEEARLGGEQRVLTIHFSDIQGFTSISEGLPPDQVVAYLADYLDLMTSIIQEHGGTLDKFMGDGILALWNAPNLMPDHAARACRAALRAQEQLALREATWAKQGRPRFRARIGLHTGEALVGNFGTPARFAYTALGDAVNLASRLEGLNKAYGTWIMASEATRAAAGPGFEWRPLDRVAVVGRREGTLVHELLGEAGEVAPSVLAARDLYAAALDAYFARRFAEAAAGFRAALAARPDDLAAEEMAARAEALAASPPPADWDGVYVSHSK